LDPDAHDDGGFLDVSQLQVQALETEGQFLVIDAEAVENRRVQIPDMHRVADDVSGEFVRLAINDAGFDAPAGQPHGETPQVAGPPGVNGIQARPDRESPNRSGQLSNVFA
jgi:hypothetical protein